MQSSDQVLLKIGAPVGVPPTGHKTLFLDTDGAVKLLDLAGNKVPVSGDAWAGTQQALMQSNVSALTRFEYKKFGLEQAAFNAGLTDPVLEGGGLSNLSGSAVFASQASVFQLMKTGRWGMGFRAKFAAPTGGQVSLIGTCNTGATHVVAVGTDNAIDTTHFMVKIIGGATTPVVTTVLADLLLHDFVLTFDATTLKVFIDGVQAGSTAVTTNLVDEPQFLYCHGTASGRVSSTRCLIGTVDP